MKLSTIARYPWNSPNRKEQLPGASLGIAVEWRKERPSKRKGRPIKSNHHTKD